jgi:4-amino-4-deoxy-L-arabinose transferase-like glycosyltransferase
MRQAGATIATEPLEPEPPFPPSSQQRSRAKTDRGFWLGVVSAVAVGAIVRFTYLFQGAPSWVLGDGLDYHLSALRLAGGLGYTSAFGDTGAPNAHHPPGWNTLLAAVSEAGGGSMWAHQVTGAVIGLGVILLAGLIGRRYGGRRVGVIAALLAAVYPGFWVLEMQILSEPLGLLVVGVLMLVLADLWQRPTLAHAVLAGAITGALALVRSEQVTLLAIAVAPLLLLNPRLTLRRRCAWAVAAVLAALVPIAPWTAYNLGRFEEPVVLSTNGGGLLLIGNCPPTTYSGEWIGFYDTDCNREIGRQNPDFDRSQVDVQARRVAFENMRDNLDRLPTTILARHGRVVGVFHPGQTVEHVASWFGSAEWPVWAWVTSFWVVGSLAAYGSVLLRRSRTFQWPLVAPVVVVILVVTVSYGEPRYHTPADLGIVVLAAVTLDHLLRRVQRPTRKPVDVLPDGRHQSEAHTWAGASGNPRTTTSTGPV